MNMGRVRIVLVWLFLAAMLLPVVFSSATIAAEEETPSSQSESWLDANLPHYLVETHILQVRLWQWIGLILLVVVSSIISYVISVIVVRVARSVVSRTETRWDDTVLEASAGPLRFVLTVMLFYASTYLLALEPSAQSAIVVICKILGVIAFTSLMMRFVDIAASITGERLRQRDASTATTLVPMGRRMTKVFVAIIAAISLMQNLGFNITGIVAGLGVGGLAIALAAQKTIENLFGGMVVIADRPVKVGDFCRAGEHIGTVEDIGLRSTRIRTLDRTLLTIPNAEFSTVRLENFAERDRIRLFTVIGVGYDTSPEQMRYLLVEIRKMLYSHPKTLPDPCRIRFVNFGAYSLDLEIFVYIETRDWNEFLSIREDIYLRIMDIVEESGTYFAYPSQTLYLGRDPGRDKGRTKSAEEAVRSWREKGEIYIPDFPQEKIRELDDTLEYPPVGSAMRG